MKRRWFVASLAVLLGCGLFIYSRRESPKPVAVAARPALPDLRDTPPQVVSPPVTVASTQLDALPPPQFEVAKEPLLSATPRQVSIPDCPAQQPESQSPCGPLPPMTTQACQYGQEPDILNCVCDSTRTDASVWTCQQRAAMPAPPACPEARPSEASACPLAGLPCNYGQGIEEVVCTCDGPAGWHCKDAVFQR